jgi:hypothetical protein
VPSRPGKPEAKDWFLPFPVPRDEIRDVQHFRSTWLTASQTTLRERGYWSAYEAGLDPKHRDQILSAVPGSWMPMAVALAHYGAADKIGIPTEELVEIGAAATRRANATTFQFITRLAQGAGATPWTLLAQAPRLWGATCDGGAVGIAKLGPKEARIEMVGFPLAGLAYNRVTMRGIVTAGVELFCKKAYVREIPSLCDHRSLGMRASWA